MIKLSLALLLSGLAIALAVQALLLSFVRLPPVSRKYLDPLPASLSRIWPLVRFYEHYVVARLPRAMKKGAEQQLQNSGAQVILRGTELLGLQCTAASLLGLLGLCAMAMLDKPVAMGLLGGGLIGALLPRIKIRDLHKRRCQIIVRQLPVFLDYLSLSVSAGLNISGAMQQAVNNGPDGPLKLELRIVLRDIRAGAVRRVALRNMARRIDLVPITRLVQAIEQADRQGTSMATVLKVQSQQVTKERFQRAEKLAMETPVKLMLPLVLFIFPTTFIVLLYPIALKIMQAGAS